MIATGVLVSTKELLKTVCAKFLGSTYLDEQANKAMQGRAPLSVEALV